MEPLQKAQERLSLHELIRVGVGRQEDLRLLQNVAMQSACLPATSVAQLLREAALREEWRSGREAALLDSLRSQSLGGVLGLGLGPGGCLSAADGRLLSEQLAALTEMVEQHQQRRRTRAAAASAAAPGAAVQRAAAAVYRGSPTSRKSPGATSHPGPRGPHPAAPAAPSSTGSSTAAVTASAPSPVRPHTSSHPYLTPLGPKQPPAPQSPLSTPPVQQQQPQPLTGQLAEGLGRRLSRPASTPSAASRSSTGLVRTVSAGSDVADRRDSDSSGTSGYDVGHHSPAAPAQRQRRLGTSVGAPGSAASVAAAAAIYGAGTAATAGGTGVVGSPARGLRSSGRGGGRQQQPSGGGGGGGPSSPFQAVKSTHGSPLSQGRLRPCSAPDGLPGPSAWDATRTAAVAAAGPVDTSVAMMSAAAATAAAAAAAVNSPPGGGGGAVGASHAAERNSGFRNLLRLQQLLVQGLREHAQAEGEGGALEALVASVTEGQHFFAECLLEALEAAGLPPDAVGGGAWDKMLRLGQLGLTRSDVNRLEEIRRQRAARVIQRQVRKWLRRRRHQRRLAEARARADAMQRKLREVAARVIQSWVRGHLARRLVARLAAEAAREGAERRRLAARAWRAHRRALRYAEVLARAEEKRRRRLQLPEQEQQQQQQGGAVVTVAVAGGQAGGRTGCGRVLMTAEQAVVVIQSHLRGWLVRRSSDLWWARASLRLRERRAGARAWRQHQRFMEASHDMQAQLLGSLVREAQLAAALEADRRRQDGEMRAAFNEWLLQQQRVALSQPLPRGWVPHPHPSEPGRMCFLNTRTGELHGLHPAVAELARHAREQHAAAVAALQLRFSGVPAYLEQVHQATAAQATIAMRAIAVVYQSAVAQAGGLRPRP
ncbi:hypothetical protein VOLCADRAFT_115922 [Volvox carteri f. nagariensis]|uniref:Uncharacterized protein n=1 Tax=Volvox carteri f. nagariensis TaxID=3068 RepID=D8TIY2_VOLCA|nr:uncharacterized protein VOLCADRAFT_115922 [Volvox carteri f. nagariensis]EFJ52278.1 hypothetical protein VOLCADRAFT_115922 [Volvox carteri f. nagariensis]|eukprot:XP_002946351.1 hypothetical protein VOLCADRAFT_115922 [Volvox carteri f. nagariensis]